MIHIDNLGLTGYISLCSSQEIDCASWLTLILGDNLKKHCSPVVSYENERDLNQLVLLR